MRNEKINYFEVIAKCGHVGKRFYIPIKFAVAAESSKEAAKIARSIPRVKHDHKDAILSVKKISYQEYVQLEEENDKLKEDKKKAIEYIKDNACYDTDSCCDDLCYYDCDVVINILEGKDK